MIAFLHTLSANVEKFDLLAQKYAADVDVKHFVNETILINALKNGKTDFDGFNAEIEKIKLSKPDLIICTCSSYGEACDRRADVERIDAPIVEYIVANYSKIGLAYAASSTRDISADLIITNATAMDKNIEIVDIDCTSAWPYYEQKNIEQYYREIAKIISSNNDEPEVIFLAQASMEGAKQYLPKNNKIEVVTSPEYGVMSLLKQK